MSNNTPAIEVIERPDGDFEIIGIPLATIWAITEIDAFTYKGIVYVPLLSYTEEGPQGEPVLPLVKAVETTDVVYVSDKLLTDGDF